MAATAATGSVVVLCESVVAAASLAEVVSEVLKAAVAASTEAFASVVAAAVVVAAAAVLVDAVTLAHQESTQLRAALASLEVQDSLAQSVIPYTKFWFEQRHWSVTGTQPIVVRMLLTQFCYLNKLINDHSLSHIY